MVYLLALYPTTARRITIGMIILDTIARVDLGQLGPGNRHKSGRVTQAVEACARINRHQCGFLLPERESFYDFLGVLMFFFLLSSGKKRKAMFPPR